LKFLSFLWTNDSYAIKFHDVKQQLSAFHPIYIITPIKFGKFFIFPKKKTSNHYQSLLKFPLTHPVLGNSRNTVCQLCASKKWNNILYELFF
jgi:hypothetical protein